MSMSAQMFPVLTPVRKTAGPVPTPPKNKDAVVVCQDNLLFMRSLPDNSMRLIATSPPYNLGKEYETKSSLKTYLDAQKETIKEAVRLLHPKGFHLLANRELCPRAAHKNSAAT